MQNIHVRLEHNETLLGKREILSAEAGLLTLLKKVRTYKNLRKRELILKNNLKKHITGIKAELKTIKESFPAERAPVTYKDKDRREIVEQKETREIESQLRDIQERLAELS